MSKGNMVSLQLETTHVHGGDTFSKPDQFVVLFTRNRADRKSDFVEVTRTEVIDDVRDARFNTLLTFQFLLSERQEVQLQLFDSDSKNPDLSKHDLLTTVTFQVDELLRMENGSKTFNFGKDDKSELVVNYEKSSSSNDRLTMDVECKGLKNKDGYFGKSDPYVVIYRHIGDGGDGSQWSETWRSKTVQNNLNPKWNSLEFQLAALCNNDLYTALKLVVYDDDGHDDNEKNGFLGETEITLEDLVEERNSTIELVKHSGDKTKKGRGTISFLNVVHMKTKSFVDYIREGLELQATIAIDMTASNGEFTVPGSLHYLAPDYVNPYEEAIRGVSESILPYDNDKVIRLLGFGGIDRRHGGNVSHCFELTPHEDGKGVENAAQSYRECAKYVGLAGPTIFHPVLELALAEGKGTRHKKKFNIFIVITDGKANDERKIRDTIVSMADAPVAIVFVGVGKGPFGMLESLDDDPIVDNRGFGGVDKVQFVNYDKVRHMSTSGIERFVLEEIPGQVEAHFSTVDTVAFQ
jgi:copine 5/8/9